MKQNNRVIVKMSTDQKDKLRRRADSCGMSLNAYCLLILINANPKITDAFK